MKGGVPVFLILLAVWFLVISLVFSFAFNKVSIFNRQINEANVIFQGDAMQTYITSFVGSIHLSLAQSIYDFYIAHKFALWQHYAENFMPSDSEIENLVKLWTSQYSLDYLGKYFESGQKQNPTISLTGSPTNPSCNFGKEDTSNMCIRPDIVVIKFDEMKAVSSVKTPPSGDAKIEIEFSPEAKFRTYFRQVIDESRRFIVERDIGKAIIRAINEFINGLPDSDRLVKEPGSESDPDSIPTTTGSQRYCSNNQRIFDSDKSDGQEPREPPSPEEVYLTSHGISIPDAERETKNKIKANVDALDEKTNIFMRETTELRSESEIEVEQLPGGGTDGCVIYSTDDGCEGCEFIPESRKWRCYVEEIKTCKYDYFGASRATVKVDETGRNGGQEQNKYAFWDGEKMVLDSIKLVFTAIDGNSKLIK